MWHNRCNIHISANPQQISKKWFHWCYKLTIDSLLIGNVAHKGIPFYTWCSKSLAATLISHFGSNSSVMNSPWEHVSFFTSRSKKTSTFSHDLNLNCVETKTKHYTIKKNWHGNCLRKRGGYPILPVINIKIVYKMCSQMPCSRQAYIPSLWSVTRFSASNAGSS